MKTIIHVLRLFFIFLILLSSSCKIPYYRSDSYHAPSLYKKMQLNSEFSFGTNQSIKASFSPVSNLGIMAHYQYNQGKLSDSESGAFNQRNQHSNGFGIGFYIPASDSTKGKGVVVFDGYVGLHKGISRVRTYNIKPYMDLLYVENLYADLNYSGGFLQLGFNIYGFDYGALNIGFRLKHISASFYHRDFYNISHTEYGYKETTESISFDQTQIYFGGTLGVPYIKLYASATFDIGSAPFKKYEFLREHSFQVGAFVDITNIINVMKRN